MNYVLFHLLKLKKMDNNMIPQIRFSEFRGEWKEKKVGEVFYVNAGGDIDKKHVSQKKTEFFQYPIYANASENKGFYAYSDIYKVEPPVITVAGRGVYIGIAHARNHRFYPIVRLLVLKPKEEQNIYFFEYRINRINLFIESTGVPQLTVPQISSYKILFPIIEEQTKIAIFLTAVDKRINLLQKKKEQLEQYKKGLMQKLFNQDIRFKDEDGNNFADWEEKKLGEICEKLSSNISANTLSENDGEYKIYGAAGYLKNVDFYREEKPYISIVKDGAGVGRMLLCEAKTSVLGTLDIIKPKGKNNLEFLYSLINQIHFNKYILGSTIPHIYFKDYSKENVKVPHPKEQRKIANVLSSIYKSIEIIGNQINDSIEFKQGLLQKMFV